MKKKIMSLLEQFSKTMVQPIMYVGVVGMIMIIGVLLTNQTLLGVLPFLQWGPIQLVGNLIYQAVMTIINNLGILFVVGLSAAFAKKEKHSAAVIGLLSYLVFLTANNVSLNTFKMIITPNEFTGLSGTGQAEVLGFQVLDMGVFSGIILGCVVGYIFNRTNHVQIKNPMFQMLSGVRFSFFVMIFVSLFMGWVAIWTWPYLQNGINGLTGVISRTNEFGLFLFGFLDRLLVPTGLHHLVYTPFLFTEVGGVQTINGQTYSGAYAIVMAELKDASLPFTDSIYYMMAMGFTKMFAYIGIGLAFIYTAFKQNRARTITLIVPLMITASVASITEPLDFLFVFVSPLLYLVHSILAGVFIVLLKLFGVTAMSGGLLNSVIMNVVLGVEKTNYPIYFLLGALQIVVYFVLFSFIIKKLNLKTPGREVDANAVQIIKPSSEVKKSQEAVSEGIDAENIVNGLGGKDNIIEVDNCFTRLRVSVKDVEQINDDLLNGYPNSGIVKKNNDIQIIYGLGVPEIRNAVQTYLENNK
ncbi:PTS glucose transporter subunit IIBC [Sporosarcina sp. ANT_H38]|uniref:PTS transporter subunit EIIC n=1 Tax=Sporosarcina sp. ANT_H38 TaxID=2597358 RepID=UPI0011F21C35|nr:PTS transporter subunit EIIC [Sporosarcina sp. ANT_H38]KAA0948696.1 PTS glucose transporter subunit IIBC [Sporosarcina sp. ANT_H38]